MNGNPPCHIIDCQGVVCRNESFPWCLQATARAWCTCRARMAAPAAQPTPTARASAAISQSTQRRCVASSIQRQRFRHRCFVRHEITASAHRAGRCALGLADGRHLAACHQQPHPAGGSLFNTRSIVSISLCRQRRKSPAMLVQRSGKSPADPPTMHAHPDAVQNSRICLTPKRAGAAGRDPNPPAAAGDGGARSRRGLGRIHGPDVVAAQRGGHQRGPSRFLPTLRTGAQLQSAVATSLMPSYLAERDVSGHEGTASLHAARCFATFFSRFWRIDALPASYLSGGQCRQHPRQWRRHASCAGAGSQQVCAEEPVAMLHPRSQAVVAPPSSLTWPSPTASALLLRSGRAPAVHDCSNQHVISSCALLMPGCARPKSSRTWKGPRPTSGAC